MTPHPVRFRVAPPPRLERVHVVIRLAFLLSLGLIGWPSLGWLFYLALPAVAALLVSQKGSARYLAEDAPAIARALRWVAAAFAYLWLLTDAFPTDAKGGPVELEVETGGAPTPGSALLRLLYSIPAFFVLALLSIATALLWIVGAIAILAWERVPAVVSDVLALTLRYQLRLIAYHLSLVDSYPSFAEAPLTQVPNQGAA